ncbi:hypothetical protein Anapl_05370 [Anas platyrhynchos]|uniref:Uncharacterized protein n=1 Tax=Anas platyrhynchos TaxID=8839 RepID=R0LKI6_ANAPL|nr:hypothetical protein Anapl_05370 [Anas platyrhynchos]
MPLNGTGAKYGNRNSLPGISYGIEQGFALSASAVHKRAEKALDRKLEVETPVLAKQAWMGFGSQEPSEALHSCLYTLVPTFLLTGKERLWLKRKHHTSKLRLPPTDSTQTREGDVHLQSTDVSQHSSRLVLTCSGSRGWDGNTAAWDSFDQLGLILGAGAAVHKRTNVLKHKECVHPIGPWQKMTLMDSSNARRQRRATAKAMRDPSMPSILEDLTTAGSAAYEQIKIVNQLGIVYALTVQKLHPHISFNALQMSYLHKPLCHSTGVHGKDAGMAATSPFCGITTQPQESCALVLVQCQVAVRSVLQRQRAEAQLDNCVPSSTWSRLQETRVGSYQYRRTSKDTMSPSCKVITRIERDLAQQT